MNNWERKRERERDLVDYMALSHKVFRLLLLLSLSSVVYVVIFVSLLSDKGVKDGEIRVSDEEGTIERVRSLF